MSIQTTSYSLVTSALSPYSKFKLEFERQVKELNEKSKDNEYLIEGKSSEKDREISVLHTDISLLKQAMSDMQQLLNNPQKLAEISRDAKPEIPQ